MRLPHIAAGLLAALCLFCGPARAAENSIIESLGENTYAVTETASNGFDLNTERLKEQALKHASDFCAEKHKEIKIVDTTVWRPKFRTLGFSYAKVVFKALDADDPELTAPPPPSSQLLATPATSDSAVSAAAQPQSPTERLYNDLLKLDDLRKRGILTEKEYEAQKKKLLKQQK